MEEFLSQFIVKTKYHHVTGKKSTRIRSRYGFIRYCDDFVITARKKEDIDYIKPYIQGSVDQKADLGAAIQAKLLP